jgi:hypothetical protein
MRKEYIKIHGEPDLIKKMKPLAEKLAFDSISDITDLSDDGILTKSMHLLSKDQ